MKTYVIGDIHGAYKALIQCLNLSNFDMRQDKLIVLGDVCDRNPEVKQCITHLLKIKNLIYILGNHDDWALDWMNSNKKDTQWIEQGGNKTIDSYGKKSVPKSHTNLLSKASLYYEYNDILFLHGGFDPNQDIETQNKEKIIWDRDFWLAAQNMSKMDSHHTYSKYKHIFIGHTPVMEGPLPQSIHMCNVWNLDTGAGWGGKLTIMDVDSKQYWQSESTKKLYIASEI